MLNKWKKQVFSPEPVNLRRQPEIDIAKFILIFMLAPVHCIIECTPEEGLASGIPFFMDSVLGGPLGAPMFTFAMGFGMAFKPGTSARTYLHRALGLGIISFVLNFCRFLVPFLVGYAATGDVERYLAPLPYRFFGNDILQYAALVFLAFALFRKLKLSNRSILAFGLLLSLAGNLLNGFYTDFNWLNILLGHLIGVENPEGLPFIFSDFPIVNWLIVPISGYLFGDRLRYVRDKKKFYAAVSPVCLLITVVYFWFGIRHELGMFGEGQNCYYHISTPDVLISIAAAFGALGIHYVLSEHLPRPIMKAIERVSRNINAVYCIHWVLVSWITMVLLYAVRGSTYLPVGLTLLLGCVISVVSILTSLLWSDRIRPFFCAHEKRKG